MSTEDKKKEKDAKLKKTIMITVIAVMMISTITITQMSMTTTEAHSNVYACIDLLADHEIRADNHEVFDSCMAIGPEKTEKHLGLIP